MTDKCCVCGKFVSANDVLFCEICEELHCPKCVGEEGGCNCTLDGEDTTYSHCLNCVKGFKERVVVK